MIMRVTVHSLYRDSIPNFMMALIRSNNSRALYISKYRNLVLIKNKLKMRYQNYNSFQEKEHINISKTFKPFLVSFEKDDSEKYEFHILELRQLV